MIARILIFLLVAYAAFMFGSFLVVGLVALGVNSHVTMNTLSLNCQPANWGGICHQWLGYQERNIPLQVVLVIGLLLAGYVYWAKPQTAK